MMVNQEEVALEQMKELNEWALIAGRTFKSLQTGFIHYSHSQPHSSIHQTIPLYENSLFVLALLRTRLVENIQEGKTLLSRLLCFQCLEEGSFFGNFPFYLHDFPHCYDPEQSVRLLAPFYWILKQFGHVLGQELRQKMERSLLQLIEFSLKTDQIKPFSYSLSVRLAASLRVCGALLQQSTWEEKGNQAWKELAHPSDSWYTTSHIANILIALQMVKEKEEGAWAPFWLFLKQTWHQQACCYSGPCIREWQDQEEPQVNLYDLFLGSLYRRFSQRAKKMGIIHLQAVLIQPFLLSTQDLPFSYSLSGLYKTQNWTLVCAPNQAHTILEKKEELTPILEKTFTPFRLVWGNELHSHTLVCQGGKYKRLDYNHNQESIELFFDLESTFHGEDKDQQREICFYLDFDSDVQMQLKEQASNTFEMDQPLTLKWGEEKKISLTFTLVQGEGDFFGHMTRSNRPSQIKSKEEKSFQTYDWTIFLRTLRRSPSCRVKATLKFL